MSSKDTKKLAKEFIGDEKTGTARIYILEKSTKKPSAKEVKRINGKPIGITAKDYPMFDGKPMEHLITLDLEEMPELQTGDLKGKSAVALFITDRESNNAHDPASGEAKIVLLTSADLKNGELDEIPDASDDFDEGETYTYTVEPVDVPTAVFTDWESDESLSDLYEAVHNSAYAGGEPTFIQSESFDGQFVFQFDDKLIKTALGDSGVMYVFTHTAFWEGF